ncbi:MAG: AI-2E family transporter [Candidatus Gastranaerophilales bacterium]|nr:AI-2E family transporter [Candidatus Gastranaerophilales bacterium]
MNIKNFASKNVILFGLGTALIILSLILIKDITLLFFTSFVIASALNPAIDKMSKRIPRWSSVLIIYLAGFLILALFLIPFVNILIQQFILLMQNAPAYWTKIFDEFNVILHKIPWISPMVSHFTSTAAGYSQNIVAGSINLTVSLMQGLVIILTLAMVVLYMVLDKEQLKKGYLRFFPLSIRDRAESISGSISRKVGGYVVGQLLSMLAVGILTSLGLFIINVKFAVLLGSIAGVLDIIPVVGPVLALIIAILVAFGQKPILVVWTLLVYMLVQWITNTFFRPAIFSKFLDLHPLIIIFAMLVAATWLGVVGVIIAPAIAATVCVLIEELYLNNINSET